MTRFLQLFTPSVIVQRAFHLFLTIRRYHPAFICCTDLAQRPQCAQNTTLFDFYQRNCVRFQHCPMSVLVSVSVFVVSCLCWRITKNLHLHLSPHFIFYLPLSFSILSPSAHRKLCLRHDLYVKKYPIFDVYVLRQIYTLHRKICERNASL